MSAGQAVLIVLGLALVLALPFYVYLLSKCAAVGRLAGASSFMRHHERKGDGGGERTE